MSGARVEVVPTTVADLRADPDIEALIAEYEAEAKSPEMPPAQPQWERYAAWENGGLLDVIAAREADTLIGFVSVMRASVPHYGAPLFVVEGLFVTAGRRRTGAGRSLIVAAKALAAHHNAALLISAPAGSALEKILPRMGCRHSNTVFVWGQA